jgi:hypothetical protein
MPEIRVFLNERGLTVPPASTVRDVLARALPDLLPAVTAGTAFVTDGRGLPLALDAVLPPGAILRAARSGRRSEADHGGS